MNLHDEIAKVAYELYEKRGRVGGHDLDDWFEAERLVMARHAERAEGAAKEAPKRRGRPPKEKKVKSEQRVSAKKAGRKKKASKKKAK
ncbi:MAG: hypothetical protein OHK0032_04810 [Thermodesulfovibrionales bacterium]